jgi:hypothetical protein
LAQASPRSLVVPERTVATPLRGSLPWKRSTIWRASGKAAPARFQIPGAPSPSTTGRGARATPRRRAARSPRGAKAEPVASVSRGAARSMAAE